MTDQEILSQLAVLQPKAEEIAKRTRNRRPQSRLKLVERILFDDGNLQYAATELKRADQEMLVEEIRLMVPGQIFDRARRHIAAGRVDAALELALSTCHPWRSD